MQHCARVRVECDRRSVRVHSFRTIGDGLGDSLVLESPNGGERWLTGSHQTIRWTSSQTSGTMAVYYRNADHWVPIGQGSIHPKFFGMLRASGFRGPITMQFEYPREGGDSLESRLKYLKEDNRVLREWIAKA